MSQRFFAGVTSGLLLMLVSGASHSQTQQPAAPAAPQAPTDASQSKPTYDPTAGAIVNGLKGVVTGTQASIEKYRSTVRFLAFRKALSTAIFSSDGKGPLTLAVTDEAILCDARRAHADIAAETTYLNAVTSALDKFASPPKITTLGEAFLNLFDKYSIDVPPANINQETSSVVANNCNNDLKNWPNGYYDYKIPVPKIGIAAAAAAAPSIPIDSFITEVSSLSALVSAIIGIVTPLAVNAEAANDAAKRNSLIDKYLLAYPTKLTQAAEELAKVASRLIDSNRYQALGQFVEKMAAARALSIDLSKMTVGADKRACTEVVKTPIVDSEPIVIQTSADTQIGDSELHFSSVPPWLTIGMTVYDQTNASALPKGVVVTSVEDGKKTVTVSQKANALIAKDAGIGFGYPTVSDNFVQCYAQAWQQIATPVADIATAASAYDSIADVSNDQLEAALDTIRKHIEDLENPNPPETGGSDLLAAATQLVAFGTAMRTALSSDNLTKLETDVNAVAKLFGAKTTTATTTAPAK